MKNLEGYFYAKDSKNMLDISVIKNNNRGMLQKIPLVCSLDQNLMKEIIFHEELIWLLLSSWS